MVTQQQFEDAVIDIIEGIYLSTLIPDDHKAKYVEYIEHNGLTEKMMTELQALFAKEQEGIVVDIEEKKHLMAELEAYVKGEEEQNDETQAAIVASVANYADSQVKSFKRNLEEIEDDLSATLEEFGKGAEKKEEEAIRAKLKKK